MKITERILLLFAVIGIILSLIPIPGGNMLTILALGLLSVLYFYFGFAFFNGIRARDMFKKSSYAGIKGIRIPGAIFTGMLSSVAVIGILFKVMMWPGASVMLLVGIVPFFVLTLITIVKYFGNKDEYYKRIFLRTIVFGSASVLLYLLPSYTIMDIKYRCCPDYINAVKEADKNPDDVTLQEKVIEERKKMNGDAIE
ncbi:GldL-related protein [Flavobacterium suzhouense]|uniref:Gliding motility protein GldL-like N-terminal domain-containing protein n=1 Tax=Flavobacterium suzhouense TaxID=1529638 RepID=A0ABW5NUD0_9FLAO